MRFYHSIFFTVREAFCLFSHLPIVQRLQDGSGKPGVSKANEDLQRTAGTAVDAYSAGNSPK
jgi:hypothetical protein